uniref:Uncharacterized protein n=1 Tax=Amphimedon queenslandica TaxID=400682 RepID=A0A1X7TBH4_AMPQE
MSDNSEDDSNGNENETFQEENISDEIFHGNENACESEDFTNVEYKDFEDFDCFDVHVVAAATSGGSYYSFDTFIQAVLFMLINCPSPLTLNLDVRIPGLVELKNFKLPLFEPPREEDEDITVTITLLLTISQLWQLFPAIVVTYPPD